jgi:hypothetical protein
VSRDVLPLLVQVLREPTRAGAFSLADWDLILRQALSANMTSGLQAALAAADTLEQLPAQARKHLDWARRITDRHNKAVRWEVAKISEALQELDMPFIVLKGAAYVMANVPAARGRLFGDVDILVPKERLDDVEHALLMHGWMGSKHDAYDQRYYREWMHELPPMENVRRNTIIDVHHAILPPTARARPDSHLLRDAAVDIAGIDRVQTLSAPDMVIHSATHLFFDGEFNHGLRDMVDLDRLLRDFGRDPAFWVSLPGRAAQLELARPLFYALRYARMLFDTPVPAAALTEVDRLGRPGAILLKLMDAMFERTLLPPHASASERWNGTARFCLYVRGNWLRMPLLMLVRHLLHKAFISPRGRKSHSGTGA